MKLAIYFIMSLDMPEHIVEKSIAQARREMSVIKINDGVRLKRFTPVTMRTGFHNEDFVNAQKTYLFEAFYAKVPRIIKK